MKERVLIVHGGGPTAVLNASLAGAIQAAQADASVEKIYGARLGMGGLLRESFIDLTCVDQQSCSRLKNTPGSAIGTSRDPLYEAEYARAVEVIARHGITCVLLNGGNGTMDTCARLSEHLAPLGVRVMGIPKTMDNDICGIDHAPGFASAAQYMIDSVREVAMDVKSLPIHVCVIEASGRNAGWITASTALLQSEGLGPDLILVPEVAYDEVAFLDRVSTLSTQKGGVLVVVSEGLKTASGEPVTPPIFKTERATYFGDVGSYLAQQIVQKLGIKARAEKPGLLGRACLYHRPPQDIEEAYQCGYRATAAALAGQTGQMMSFTRRPGAHYQLDYAPVDLQRTRLQERCLPPEWLCPDQFTLTSDFCDYLRPLLKPNRPEFMSWL